MLRIDRDAGVATTEDSASRLRVFAVEFSALRVFDLPHPRAYAARSARWLNGDFTLLAFFLCLLIFVLWTIVGCAVLRLLDPTRNRVQRILLAPPIGLVTTLVPLFLFSRWGFPIGQVAVGVTAIVVALAVAGFVVARKDSRAKSRFPRGRYWPFGVALFIVALFACRPMFVFGFDWLSFCNDDMANYCLSAQRYLHNGMFDLPPIESLGNGVDYSQNFWFMYARDGQRPGSDLLLAWVCGNTGLSTHAAFMPTIMAMHLGLVSATAGAVLRSRRKYKVALLTAVLVGLTAMSTFGALSQLIAQVSGLGILIVSGTLLMRPMHTISRRLLIRYAVLCTWMLVGFLINYPELTPFLGLSVAGYYVVQWWSRRRLPWMRLAVMTGVVGSLGVVVMGGYTFSALQFLSRQMSAGRNDTDIFIKLFPFYLMPSGTLNVWSLQKVSYLWSEPIQSLLIIVSIILTMLAIGGGIRLALRGEPMAFIFLVMVGLTVQLFRTLQAFGLYKMAMFIQPFLWVVMAFVIFRLMKRWPRATCVLALGYLAMAFNTQWKYITDSYGQSGYVEIRGASELRLTSRFDKMVRETKPTTLILDTPGVALAKYQLNYTIGVPTGVPSHEFFENIQKVGSQHMAWTPSRILERADALLEASDAGLKKQYFDLHRRTTGPATPPSYASRTDVGPRGFETRNPFMEISTGSVDGNPINNEYLIAAGGALSIINRFYNDPHDMTQPFIAMKMEEVRDILMFKFSDLGVPFGPYLVGLRDDDRAALFQLEHDIMFSGEKFAGIGRYLLFEALRPTEDARMMLEITSTLKSDGSNRLPNVDAIGDTRESMPTVGRGSARVFSPPLKPQVINGRNYYMLDMNEFGNHFPSPRRGLMNLYGTKLLFDRRRLVAFARDVSLINPTDYAAINAPASVSNFPADLLSKHLEYSGIYEIDGWISEHSYFMLDAGPSQRVVARGVIPDFQAIMPRSNPFTTTATLLVDGQVVATKALQYGEFSLEAAIEPKPGRRKVELKFSDVQKLPPGDDRPVAAKMSFVGFE